MDDIYNDLENYDEVDLVNELRSENSDLKHKLEQCTTSMEILQKDFDKLSAEFKKLEMNYSSLLKIARAEIKRKTDMITNLNIEKDMLVIKATQNVSPNKVQKLIRNIGSEAKHKKKKRNKKKRGQKEKDEFNRDDCEHPPASETSSTATDNTNKILSKERGDSVKSISRNATKENEIVKPEAFDDRRGDDCRSPIGAIVDRRVSELARPTLAKLSSDEEFEDMYSALGPKTPPPREAERSRKRGRDRSQDAKTYNQSGPQDKLLSYPEPFRECYVRNKANRFSASERNMNRDIEYNECDRNMSRDKQYYENDRNVNRGNFHRKYSPERHRRTAREFRDDRYSQQYVKHRRLESPPRERYLHRSRERAEARIERRPHYDRERDDQRPYDHPDKHSLKHRIHGEYDEPQNKRPRVELHSHHQDDRRQSERQYYKESHPTDVTDRTCQSPDFSHAENESSNEPVITTTDSIEVSTEEREDPRLTSNKYVKTIDGTKEVLHLVNVKEVDLQPLNRSLWNVDDIQVPLALKRKPLEISEELVEEMDTDKPLSILSMESGEVASETTDTYTDDLLDYREVDEGIHSNKCVYSKNDNLIIEKRRVISSPTDKTSKKKYHKRDVAQMESKLTGHKYANLDDASNSFRADDDHYMSNKELSDPQGVDEGRNSNNESVSCKNDNLKIEKRKDVGQAGRSRSFSDKTLQNVEHESDIIQLQSKSGKHKLANPEANNLRDDEDTTIPNKGLSDHREVDAIGLSSKRVSSKIAKKKDKKSAIEKTSKDTHHKYDVVQMETKSIRQKLGKSEEATHYFRSDDGLRIPSKEFSNHREVDEGSLNHKEVSSKNDNLKIEGRKTKKSPIEKTSEVTEHKSDVVKTRFKSTRDKLSESKEDSNEDDSFTNCKNAEKPGILQRLLHSVLDKSEKGDNHKADKPIKKSSQDSNKVDPDLHCDNTEKSSILHRPFNPVSNMHESPESVYNVKSKRTEEMEPKNTSDLTIINSEKETESNVSIFRDFEHRVYSTRHIVEGDLELSDDSNDEALVKIDKKVQVKNKLKTKKKSHRDTSKEKPVDSEDTTRRTRSKKDKVKEVKPQNKFSELFGDSSSLITPEDLNLATKEAHALPADCCPPLCEDAQDGIIHIPKLDQIPHISESKENSIGSVEIIDKLKTTKDSKNRSHHKKHKDMEGVTFSNDTPKDPKELLNVAQYQKVDSSDGQLVSEIKLVSSSEKLKEMQYVKLTSDKNKNDLLKSHENPKETAKSIKKPKSKHEKKLSTSESTEESDITKAYSLETSSNKALVLGDNKENANYNDNSDKNISSEMAKIFETVSSKNTTVESGKVNEEKIQLNESVIEAISSNTAQDVPNLAPVMDEPGLVKTVVISTGNQHIDSNTEPLNALASSTPAKEIPAMDTSDIESKNKQTTCINVTIASEDSVSQSETDAPDVRINFYKRRRTLKKI